MIGAVAGYLIARPFLKEAARKRRDLKNNQRIAHNASRANAARHRGEKITFSEEERAYMAAHAVSPYRT